MRLDKFMKVARLSKRRTVAKEALDAGRVLRAGYAVKAGYQVKTGDELEIHYARRVVTVRVLVIPARPGVRVDPTTLYEVLTERNEDDLPPL
ncbi:RNA-binding S4 domain-containing protein [bacterium]|nr:MAG: RNA-binding S4 domain-containing protein [bacterium]